MDQQQKFFLILIAYLWTTAFGKVLCLDVLAKDYFVAPTGSDSNPGTIESPFRLSRASPRLKSEQGRSLHKLGRFCCPSAYLKKLHAVARLSTATNRFK